MVVLIYTSIGEMKDQGMGVADLAGSLLNIEQAVLAKTKDNFDLYGLSIDKVSGLYISLPEEVQKAVDTRSSMTVLGTNYIGYETGQAMRDAASNPSGGTAGIGVGLGAGIGMGSAMVDQMKSSGSGQSSAGGAAMPFSNAPQIKCPKCGAMNPSVNKFCSECGTKLESDTKCPKCGANTVPATSKFCPECGNPMGKVKCPNCGAEVPVGTKFCPECGKSIQ